MIFLSKKETVNTYSKDGIVITKGENSPKNYLFRLHNHDSYELYLFISGDAVYNIEGRTYPLNPYDMFFVRPDEMHRVYHNSENKIYRRMIINIDDIFFTAHGIEMFKKTLIERSQGKDRKIRGSTVIESGIKDICDRLYRVIGTGETDFSPVVNALVVELLYTMCNVDYHDKGKPGNSKVQNAIDYINENFSEEITLDDICKNTFISKHHLCRIFKQVTGYSVGEYINHKRLMQISFLCKNNGMSLKEACDVSGFSNYSCFYRAYKKENGVSPREGLRLALTANTEDTLI